MNLRAIDLNLLPVFEAIYVERNLTRAGAALHVTQPAVSNALSRLRAAFGDPLFVRSGRGMAPTPAAQAIIGPVREALAGLRASLEPRRAFDPATSERILNIAVRDVAAAAIVPVLAKRLEQEAPMVRLHCQQFDRADIPREFGAGRLDFAIDIPTLARSELGSAALMTDRLVCALRRGHPKLRRRLGLDDFLGLRHIVVSSRRSGRTIVDDALSRIDRKVRPVMRLQHYQPAFHVVTKSDMALTAPLSLAQRYDVAVRELPFASPKLELLLFWRRDMAEEPGMRWMRAALTEAAREDRPANSETGKPARSRRRRRR